MNTHIFRFILLSTCLSIATSCNEKVSHTAKEKAPAPIKAEAKEKANQEEMSRAAEAEAHFESGIQAANANDMTLAYKEFLAAAKEGHIYAQYNVALMCEQGLGTAKDEKEAVHWYKESALQGSSASQFNLGVCYENGIGTSVDFEKANEWYRKASIQGDGLAIGNLGMLYLRGDGVKVNQVAGVALLLLSTTVDPSPENQARSNISKTRGLTTDMITEAQALSDEMLNSSNMLVTLDDYLGASE